MGIEPQAALTTKETEELGRLESVIDQGLKTFVEVGNALTEIRDKRLYREVFGTFEEYCRDRWGFSRVHAKRLVNAAEVVKNITTEPIGSVPATESQARPLARFAPDDQVAIWQRAVETSNGHQPTGAHVELVARNWLRTDDDEADLVETGDDSDDEELPDDGERPFNYKRDSKVSRPVDERESKKYDRCQTPPYATDPLLPYLPDGVLWEPASGEGYLVEAFYDAGYQESQVITSDLLTGQNFFDYEPDSWDFLVTNPPYSIKFKWLKRCYQLGKPFALLLQVEVLGTQAAQRLFEEHGIEVVLLDKRADFKMPNAGWTGGGAQFSTAWFTWGLNIGKGISYGRISPERKRDWHKSVQAGDEG